MQTAFEEGLQMVELLAQLQTKDPGPEMLAGVKGFIRCLFLSWFLNGEGKAENCDDFLLEGV